LDASMEAEAAQSQAELQARAFSEPLTEGQKGQPAEESSHAGRKGAFGALREKFKFLMPKRRQGAESDERVGKQPVPQVQPQAQQAGGAKPSHLEARTQEFQVTQADVFKRVKRLAEMLSAETKRREGAEHQADEVGQQRNELQTQIGKLREELESAQKQLQSQQEKS